MKVNVKKILKDYQGRDIKMRNEENKLVPVTVREALNLIINGAELSPTGQPVPIPAGTKGRIYYLSTKLWGAKEEMKVSVEDATFIKERAGKVANVTPLVYGRICDILDGKDEKEEKSKPKA